MRRFLQASLLISIIIINYSCEQESPFLTGYEGMKMPKLNLYLSDSATKFSSDSDFTEKQIVFFYFSTKCPYCRAQISDIIENENRLNQVKIILVSSTTKKNLKNFIDKYKLQNHKKILVTIDASRNFATYFKIRSVPYFVVSSPEGILKRFYNKRIDVNKLIDLN